MKRQYILLISILMVLILGFSGCISLNSSTTPSPSTATTVPSSSPTPIPASSPATTTPVPPPLSASGSLLDIEASLEHIYSLVNPSVVNISVLENASTTIPQIPGLPFTGPQVTEALGSGFVWDNSGHIVTNNHVVANADNISVTFYDGTIVPARLVGTDADSDLAVVEVTMPFPITPVVMGNSDQLKVGQVAIAIGNPFGLQGTMTLGIISGVGRVLPANESAAGPSYTIPDVIQTDTAINPGNSGGVLLDDAGRVIGVTSSIATTTGTTQGVGFAIPASIVRQVIPSLIKNGRYDHPYLGISLISLTPGLNAAMGLPSNQRGALVETVTAGGPAAKAGIQASQKTVTINGQQIQVGGDVIIAYNGQTVKSSDDLVTFLVRAGAVGQTATLTVLRGSQQVQVQVTLGVRPSS